MKKWLVLIVIFLISACSTADVSQVPTPTLVPLPPTPQPNVVTFDGYECNLTAPAVLPIGKHSILLKNLSDEKMGLSTFLISPGHTYQELLDLQSEPGVAHPIPDWLLDNALKTGYQVEPNGDRIYTFVYTIAGEYMIDIGWSMPDSLWLCGTFQVIEE